MAAAGRATVLIMASIASGGTIEPAALGSREARLKKR
jgi:hypothetical protein